MVNIDTVYQKVLALSNKEQRGYITPQEFNLLADRVQNEIFENYFHERDFIVKNINSTIFSDIINKDHSLSNSLSSINKDLEFISELRIYRNAISHNKNLSNDRIKKFYNLSERYISSISNEI